MSISILRIGTGNAQELPISSDLSTNKTYQVKTTGDLLAVFEQDPPRHFRMLRTTCGLLGTYLGLPVDRIPLDTIEATAAGFRPFLTSRKYAKSSIRSYLNYRRMLLKVARRFGWDPDANVPEAWKAFLELAAQKKLLEMARYIARFREAPSKVTLEDLDRWGESRICNGFLFTTVAAKQNEFLRLLRRAGYTTLNSRRLIKQQKYGIPLEQMSPTLRLEIENVLRWKQAKFAINRPKRGKLRPITARKLRLAFCQLAGFVFNVCGIQAATLKQLLQKQLVEGFVEWAINERGMNGRSVHLNIVQIAAAVKHHPSLSAEDFSWLKPLTDSIPLEDESERKKRKAMKFINYEVLEQIPAQLHQMIESMEKKNDTDPRRIARLAMERLMILWLLVLPWRQRNLRECRVDGSNPNLFKGKIPPYCDIDKPSWVIEEEADNPNAEFWQARFSPDETKTEISVHIVLPRKLIGPLEEYLAKYRPTMLRGMTSETLIVNEVGKAMRADQVERPIGHWTLQFASVRSTPHMFRDAVAFKWLTDHPNDYLTLSKMLWHKNVQTTIRIYGARFNESSGANAMGAWLDDREKEKRK